MVSTIIVRSLFTMSLSLDVDYFGSCFLSGSLFCRENMRNETNQRAEISYNSCRYRLLQRGTNIICVYNMLGGFLGSQSLAFNEYLKGSLALSYFN